MKRKSAVPADAKREAALRRSGLESGDYESSDEVTRYDYNNSNSNMHKDCRKGADFLLFCYCVSHKGQYQQTPND